MPLRDVQAFLDKYKIQYISTGNQYRIVACPFCGDEKEHFYVHKDLGLWDCKKCGERGNLYDLAKQLDVAEDIKSIDKVMEASASDDSLVSEQKLLVYQRILFKNKRAMRYLRERGFTEDTITHFRLGLKKEGEERWLVIPHFQSGVCVNLKYRSLPPAKKSYKRSEGGKSVLFNLDNVDLNEPLFITEGEFDAIMMWQQGYKNVIGATLGATGFRGEWVDLLDPCKKVFIVYDNDEEGQVGAGRLARRLGINRCWNVTLPVKDANDYFLQHTVKGFERRIKRAKRFDVSGVVDLDDAFKRYMERFQQGDQNDVEWPWARMEKMTRGFQPGGVTALMGRPGTGKTSMALNVSCYNVMQDRAVLFYCFEMPSDELIPRLVGIVRDVPHNQQTYDDVVMTRAKLLGKPLYFGGDERTLDIGMVRDTIEQAVLRYNIKLVVFDHLHWLCRDVKNISQEISYITRELKRLARVCDTHILLIVHPRKGNENKFLTMDDIRDSSAVPGDVDVIVALHRHSLLGDDFNFEGEGTLSDEATIRVLKARNAQGGQMLLEFRGECFRFREYGET